MIERFLHSILHLLPTQHTYDSHAETPIIEINYKSKKKSESEREEIERRQWIMDFRRAVGMQPLVGIDVVNIGA